MWPWVDHLIVGEGTFIRVESGVHFREVQLLQYIGLMRLIEMDRISQYESIR